MRQSLLTAKTLREAPKDEESVNAILLARAGFIDKLAAGIYSFLPLGLRVLRKIENIIREEMLALGGQEILMPALQPKDNWAKTGRWETLDVMFKLKGLGDKDYALGSTHEEIVAPLAKKMVLSYKDLPFSLFQIQTKFRNEARAKSGLLRGREFSMKDLYSFHANQESLDAFYQQAIAAYFKVFDRCCLKTYLTAASGGSFAKYSHEFQMASPAGEDTIYICENCKNFAINKEIKNETPNCPECGGMGFTETPAIEVGNIFKLGTKYSAPFGLAFKDEKGQEQVVVMGCYGIGPSRVMGAIVEASHDEQGLIWPESVAPFKYHLLALGDDDKVKQAADKLYEELTANNIEVLYDDRALPAGQKFAECDLIGLPWRLVVSEKTLVKDSIELKKRDQQKTELIKLTDITKRL